MAKSSEGAGNFSLVLKLMSKIALLKDKKKSELAWCAAGTMGRLS
jgi:hypothetical protein